LTQETSYIKTHEKKFNTVTLITTLVLADGPRFYREAILVLGINFAGVGYEVHL
jgi:hypothetical protein